MNISIELAQAIVNYLGRQPYGEVFQMINELQKQAQVKPEEKDEKQHDKTTK